MASELKVDKFTGVTTAGSIDVVGEGNSTTTNLQQGLAKCWSVNFTLTSSSGADEDSFNLASTTDNSTGDASLNFTNVYANRGFTSHAMAGNNADVFGTTKYADATTFARLQLYRQSTTSVVDNAFSATTHGDLA
jgi:hypothetical protein